MMKAILKEIEDKTPATGYNLVAIDEYELPGERVTILDHVDSKEEANKRLKALQRGSPDGEFAVYGADDASHSTTDDFAIAAADRVRMGLPAKP